MDYYLEIKVNSDTFNKIIDLLFRNSSEGKTKGNYNDRRPHNVGFALFVDFNKHYITFDL